MNKLKFFVVALATVLAMVCAPFVAAETVMAATVVEPATDLAGLITLMFGDSAPAVIGWVSFALVVWSQLRQLIPARWLAWLPDPVVTFLEWLASNLGQSSNHFENNPKLIKKMK